MSNEAVVLWLDVAILSSSQFVNSQVVYLIVSFTGRLTVRLGRIVIPCDILYAHLAILPSRQCGARALTRPMIALSIYNLDQTR